MSKLSKFPPYGFGYMLFGMILLLFMSSTEHDVFSPHLVRISISVLLVASVYLLSRDRKKFLLVGLVFGIPTMLSTWFVLVYPTTLSLFFDYLSNALFFSYVTYVVIHNIFTSKEITKDTLLGSVCIYLLLGFIWSFLYGSLAIMNVDAIHGLDASDVGSMVYFSFVTLSTLGYGDIVPLTRPARLLVSAEAIAGQFYLAILVARLMGMYTPKSKKPRKT